MFMNYMDYVDDAAMMMFTEGQVTRMQDTLDGLRSAIGSSTPCGPEPPQLPASTTPLYRYWNPQIGDHFYTTNWSELGSGRFGWTYEGVQAHVYPPQQQDTVPLYRYWNPQGGDHFYTTNWNELGNGRYGWRYEGRQCHVLTQPRTRQSTSGDPEQSAVAEGPPFSFAVQAAPDPTAVGGSFATLQAGTTEVVPDSFRTIDESVHGPTDSFTVVGAAPAAAAEGKSASFEHGRSLSAGRVTITINVDE